MTTGEYLRSLQERLEVARDSLKAPSELPPSEIGGPVSSLAVATCCLEASSAEALITKWEEDARYTTYRLVQATLNRCAADLRREMGAAKSRQPEENAEMTDGYRRPDATTSPKSERR